MSSNLSTNNNEIIDCIEDAIDLYSQFLSECNSDFEKSVFWDSFEEHVKKIHSSLQQCGQESEGYNKIYHHFKHQFEMIKDTQEYHKMKDCFRQIFQQPCTCHGNIPE